MGKINTTIEINGKRYDANTGELLFEKAPVAMATVKKPATQAKASIKPDVMPAKIRKSAPKPAAQKNLAKPSAKSAKKIQTSSKQPSMHDVVRRKPATQSARRQQAPAKTLMRSAVKKPTASLKRTVKAHSSTDSLAAAPLAQVSTKASIGQLDPRRAHRAQHIKKSQLVNHFSKEAPSARQPIQVTRQPQARTSSTTPVQSATAVRPKPARTSTSAKTSADLLEKALQNARSHEQPLHKLPKRRSKMKRRAGLAGAAVLSVAALGFFVSQNVPNAMMHMASARAGFQAELPDYKPAGYNMGALNYSEGQVAAQYLSTSNDSTYTVTQKRTSWDSQALLASVVKPADPNYQTVEAGGRTIFIYGKRSATWVNGGVWYQIQSSGTLSARQLVDIANSL